MRLGFRIDWSERYMKILGDSKIARIWHRMFPYSKPRLLYDQIMNIHGGTLLDVGCGSGAFFMALKEIDPTGKLRGLYTVGLDISHDRLVNAKRVYNDIVRCDIRYMPLKEYATDIVLCHHVIEHLDKQKGRKLLQDLNLVTSKLIMVATPVGFVPHKHGYEDIWQFHRSGWLPDDFRKSGFKVFGTGGPMVLYGRQRSKIWYFPPVYWSILALTLLLLINKRPYLATELTCIKQTH